MKYCLAQPPTRYLTGSAVNEEGESYTGQIEGNFLWMYEDDLLRPHTWTSDIKEGLKADAEKWRATAGLKPDDISWGDTVRAGGNQQSAMSKAKACCLS